ncbi:GntR family transcriptional regulator [Murimonas intestini]|uniref:GntR family transcriptional regulator n=1 Tax=Murimonas intestini TaxID=1337051 RepID=A0AB73T366_9FIRM|nr:GntR family transcriptional regulator [Murimonas intestini]MCR1841577.1 GntR family transcriptional regulator [Murimonas intestini]MCR1867082.1 GntR family transcriptional regulator [Murimonas intestini]MCR1884105.1 GntR family transcriptional regulator [Murimonas intestini]
MGFNTEQPIYLQIGMDIKEQIVSRKLAPGEKLRSVREYSVLYEVSPLTVQRAMQYLESEGIIYSQKGVGNFIKADVMDGLEGSMLDEQIHGFIVHLRKCGLSDEDIIGRILKEMKNSGEEVLRDDSGR